MPMGLGFADADLAIIFVYSYDSSTLPTVLQVSRYSAGGWQEALTCLVLHMVDYETCRYYPDIVSCTHLVYNHVYGYYKQTTT